MENPLNQKAIDAAERQAHRINDDLKDRQATCDDFAAYRRQLAAQSGRMCHCIECQPNGDPMKGQMLARIKAGFQPDGCFMAKAKDGAVVSLQANLNGGLILTIEGPGPRMEFIELSV